MALLDMAGHLIRRLHQISGQIFLQNMEAAGYDITPVQYAAMQALQVNPGMEQAQIAAMIAYDRATIGGVIERLEQKGYVSRAVSPRDRRARDVNLTEKGFQVIGKISPVVEQLQKDILSGLTEAEKQQFVMLARKAVVTRQSEEDRN